MFPKKYFQNTKKEKLPRPFETASLLAPYLCLLYELLHVYFYLFRELRADGTFYVLRHSVSYLFSGMPSLFQLANPFCLAVSPVAETQNCFKNIQQLLQ